MKWIKAQRIDLFRSQEARTANSPPSPIPPDTQLVVVSAPLDPHEDKIKIEKIIVSKRVTFFMELKYSSRITTALHN